MPSFEEEDRPTIVSRPQMGAVSASSAQGTLSSTADDMQSRSASRTAFDDQIDRVRASGHSNLNSPSGAVMNNRLSALEGREDETVIIRPEAGVCSVAFLYCRKGLRRGQLSVLRKARNEFGRAGDCDVMVEDDASSAHHGAFLLEDETWKIFDFASTNGTVVNGQKLSVDAANPFILSDGDIVTIGQTEMVFKKI